MAYPTTEQIHDEIVSLALANSAFCSVMTLKKSVLATDITALKIHKVTDGRRAKVLFTGGMHANELAPPRAIVSCMQVLLDAYGPPARPITYGTFSLTASDVKNIVEHVDIYALPLVNPDGYDFALSVFEPDQFELFGRKNARVTATCAEGRPGVNINRNFDIVWDFEKFYAPKFMVSVPAPPHFVPGHSVKSSTNPCENNYTGIKPAPNIGAPFSEPETENVRTLLDEGVEFYVDCHMWGPTVLHSWGIGTNQTLDPDMRFNNPIFDGHRRGTLNMVPPPPLTYKEFVPLAELNEIVKIANHMSKAITDGTNVAGRTAAYPFAKYKVQQSAELYAVSGAADDYAYSRHLVNPALPFVRALTVEFGDVDNTMFRPTEEQYVFVEQEVHCALLSLLHFVATWVGKQPVPGGHCPIVLLLGAFHPAVELLRHLRDVSFRETSFGCSFIDAVARVYAFAAPPLARWLEPRHKLQRVLTRVAVEPALRLLRAAAAAASRLPSPPLRVAALIALFTSICALPLAFGVMVRFMTPER